MAEPTLSGLKGIRQGSHYALRRLCQNRPVHPASSTLWPCTTMIDDDKFIDTGVNTGSEGSTLRGTSPSSQHGLLDSPVGFKCTIGSSRSSKLVATASPDTPDASPVIWVDFAPLSPQDPFHFTRKTKARIMALVLFFAFFTCFEMSTFAISSSSMRADLDMTALQEAAGVSLYGWVRLLSLVYQVQD